MSASVSDTDVEMVPPATADRGVFDGVLMHVRGSFHSKVTIKNAEDLLTKQGDQPEDRESLSEWSSRRLSLLLIHSLGMCLLALEQPPSCAPLKLSTSFTATHH
jgi:hypothetical protein